MGKKKGKKLGNDDRFLIFYNFCCNCTFYMRLEYVGGMVWQFCVPRAHAQYVHPKGTKPNFRIWSYFSIFGKKYFAPNVPYVCKYLTCARGIWKFNTWWVFDRYFIPPKNSKILVRFYLRNWRFLDKKCQNFKKFSLAQNDPISLLNPWNMSI